MVETPAPADADRAAWLLCRIGGRQCALPLAQVIETMRPQPLTPVRAGAVPLHGVAMIRGVPVPVLDTARLLGGEVVAPGRLVTVRAGDRQVAVAVDAVTGIRSLPAAAGMPPLLQGIASEAVATIAALDAELLYVLATACLVPAGWEPAPA